MIHHVFANRSNIGDWLSAISIQQLLNPLPVVEHLCDEPFVPETLEALSTLNSNDLIIIGGGGLFMDYFMPFWEGFLPLSSQIPFYIWGVGFCDMKRTDSKPRITLLREIISRSRGCHVRDFLSYNYIDLPGLPEPVGCPAMNALKSIPKNSKGHILHVVAFDNVGAPVYDKMNSISREYAVNSGRQFVQIDNQIEAGSRRGLDDVLELYSKSSFVVTGRLHGCIVAAAMEIPFVAVSGDHKVESFMKQLGLEEWVLDTDAIDELPEKIEILDKNPPCIRSRVEAVRSSNHTIAIKIKADFGNLTA